MKTLKGPAFLALALLGCSDPGALTMDDGKADSAARKSDAHCVVASVLDDGVLEESLASAFDIDRRGSFEGDSDAMVVDISMAKGRAMLGTSLFSKANGDQLSLVAADPADAHPHRTYRIVSDDQTIELKVFTGSGVGTLTVTEKGKQPNHFANLDCRPTAKVPNDDDAHNAANCAGTSFEGGKCRFRNGQLAAAKCCNTTCDVTLLDDGELEESFGPLWDLSADGEPQQDEDATSVAIDWTTEEIHLGTSLFAKRQGDTLGRQPGLESEWQFFTIDGSDGNHYELRIFDTSRLGVVLVKKPADAEPHLLGRLDCRGLTRPALFE